jgi:predicted nuclease of predicted toxin-antitoxin system
MRFIIDENLPRALAHLLVASGHDAVCVVDVGRRSAPDYDINNLAITEDRIIITRDLDFPLQDQPRPPGLILFRMAENDGREEILDLLRSLIAERIFESAHGTIIVAAPGRFRSRPITDA